MTYTDIYSPVGLDIAMTRKLNNEFWYLEESFKSLYGKKQLLEVIIVQKILSEFKELSNKEHYRHNQKALLGLLGELTTKYCVGGKLSDNLYDQNKDMMSLDKRLIEVKVVSYFHMTDSLYIKDNYTNTTIKKLKSVDDVYCVERKKNSIVLHRSINKDFESKKLRWGTCIFAPISDFEEIASINNSELHGLFLKFSDKNFNRKFMRN